ncbi:hypothetical protein LSI01_02820 [Furfurilactobacillus siliginis]|uniref:Uncharacterized protein n=1 Tax=Furfurilactobacillus siliginis TaxID=348151 RepID=A0A510VPK3_9LACO|nr:hypothetical protein LSI01_02820 [Furfurilactobacillus siliginis]
MSPTKQDNSELTAFAGGKLARLTVACFANSSQPFTPGRLVSRRHCYPVLSESVARKARDTPPVSIKVKEPIKLKQPPSQFTLVSVLKRRLFEFAVNYYLE